MEPIKVDLELINVGAGTLNVNKYTEFVSQIDNELVALVQSGVVCKCLHITSLISRIISATHQYKPQTSQTQYKFVKQIIDQNPYLQYHSDLCTDHLTYVRSMQQLTIIAHETTINKEKILLDPFNPNMVVLSGDLPLEIAIKNNNLDMVQWLVKREAILFAHKFSKNQANQHVPNIADDGDLLPGVVSINMDILEHIIDNGAYGNVKSLINLLLRLGNSSDAEKLHEYIGSFLNRYSYRYLLSIFGSNKKSFIRAIMNKYNHAERCVSNDLASLFQQIASNINSNYGQTSTLFQQPCMSLMKFLFEKRLHIHIARLLKMYSPGDINDGIKVILDEYDLVRYIREKGFTNVDCIVRFVKMDLFVAIDIIKEKGYLIDDSVVSAVYKQYKHNPTIIAKLHNSLKITKFTADMYSLPMVELIISNYKFVDSEKITDIRDMLDQYNNLSRFDLWSARSYQNDIKKDFMLHIVNKYFV